MLRTYDLKDQSIQYIDVRAPREYNEGSIPGAINMPLFSDEGHERVGTVYKQKGEQQAKKVAMAHVAQRLPDIYDQFLEVEAKASEAGKQLVIYCARGGMRSRSIQGLLENIGHSADRLDGGYKAYRQKVLEALETACKEADMVVLHGMTGVGKTQILKALSEKGLGVIDIEGICRHRGSLLGRIGKEPQRSQKDFEHDLLKALLEQSGKPIFVEAESKRLGRNTLPDSFMAAMERGKHIEITADVALRRTILCREYVFSSEAVSGIHDILNEFRKGLGHKAVDELQAKLLAGDYEGVAEVLMLGYYDPKYKHASRKVVYDTSFHIESVAEGTAAILSWYEGDECIVK